MKPTDLPDPESHAHGTRARYCAAKCRCSPCRAANTAYEKERARARRDGDWNGLVPADAAQAHLDALRKLGVGKRAVAAASDVPYSIVHEVVTGRKLKIRARTAKRILAVDAGAASDRAVIPARETWKLIRDLLRRGYTRGELAIRLGRETPALQLNERKVLAKTAHQVAKLHREIMAEIALEAATPKVCGDCGYSHEPAERQRLIRRAVENGASSGDIREEWSCFYGDSGRSLHRDIAEVKAREAA